MAARTTAAEGQGEFQVGRLGPCLSPPEPETQRGRRRARSPQHLSMDGHAAHQQPSRESSTLRGRCRHRSASLMGGIASRNPSSALSSERSSSRPPTQRQLHRVSRAPPPQSLSLPLLHHNRRHRSQCPSRSRSTDGRRDKTPHRRRQRTRSRARVHRLEGSFIGALDLAPSPLQFEMVVLAADQQSGTSPGKSRPG